MSDLSPGQEVTVSGMSGGRATLVRIGTTTHRVRMEGTGKERNVRVARVTPKRESKALSVVSSDDSNPWPTVASDYAQRNGLRPCPKPVTLRSEPYLAYVRKHPCCLCGAPGPSEPHHWSHHGGVMGSKVDDYRTVPLCQEHHRHWHDHGTLPGLGRVASEWRLTIHQRQLLEEWCGEHMSNGDMVDALIRAIGGTDA